MVRREVGKGEYRGLEFLEVESRSIVNKVPRVGYLPFEYTINAYRGCSHACSYCLAGETPILMADGRAKALVDVRPGDLVYGTERIGSYRRFVPTPVLDHWSTVKRAFRITLEDGTRIIASGDHRFLTDRGWKHVTGTEQGVDRRPHLTPNDRLMGVGPITIPPRKRTIDRTALKVRSSLGIVAIEDVGVEIPMFDITTGTGDFIADRVVSHNCFARPTHDYLGLGIGEDFETKIVVKVNAVALARHETSPARWAGDLIAMGTNTDPYQAAEGKYRLTRGIVEVLAERRNPFSILTKSSLVLRDVDVLAEAARAADVTVSFSVGTLDSDVWRLTEPGTPHPMRRIEAVRKLNDAGVRSGVLMGPILPGLSDHPDQIEEVVAAAVGAGAVSVGALWLHLKPGVKEHYLAFLERERPDLVEMHRSRYTRRSRLSPQDQKELSALVAAMVRHHRATRQGGIQNPTHAAGT